MKLHDGTLEAAVEAIKRESFVVVNQDQADVLVAAKARFIAAIRALASKPAQVGDEINTALAPLRNLAEDQHATDKQRATAVHAIELIKRLAATPVEPAIQGVDADGIEAAVAAFRESTFDALTMDECRDAAKLAVEAYFRALASPSSKDKEAAAPTPAGEGSNYVILPHEDMHAVYEAKGGDRFFLAEFCSLDLAGLFIRALSPAVPAASPVQGVDGWQLVPKEPTLEQGEAGIAAMCADEDAHAAEKVRDTYKAMLDATPQSPSTDERVKK